MGIDGNCLICYAVDLAAQDLRQQLRLGRRSGRKTAFSGMVDKIKLDFRVSNRGHTYNDTIPSPCIPSSFKENQGCGQAVRFNIAAAKGVAFP